MIKPLIFVVPAFLLISMRIVLGPKNRVYQDAAFLFLLYCVAVFIGIVMFEIYSR